MWIGLLLKHCVCRELFSTMLSDLEGKRKKLVCKSSTSKPPPHLFWPALSSRRQPLSALLSQLSSPPVRKVFIHFTQWESSLWNCLDRHWGLFFFFFSENICKQIFWGQLISSSECLPKAASFCFVLLPSGAIHKSEHSLVVGLVFWNSWWGQNTCWSRGKRQISIGWVDY